MREDFISTSAHGRTWESFCDKHTDTEQPECLRLSSLWTLMQWPADTILGGELARAHTWATDTLWFMVRRWEPRGRAAHDAVCPEDGGGVSVTALEPPYSAVSSHKAILCLRENSSNRNWEGAGEGSRIRELVATPSVSSPFSAFLKIQYYYVLF